MSKPSQHTYTAFDIQRYHAGDMSAAERHALEKAALDDPFLADALEGYLLTNTPLDDLQKLQERLVKKETKKRVAPFVFLNREWMRVAALFVLVAGGGWLVYDLTLPQKQEVAREQKAPVIQSNDSATSVQESKLPPTIHQATPDVSPTASTSIPQNKKDKSEWADRKELVLAARSRRKEVLTYNTAVSPQQSTDSVLHEVTTEGRTTAAANAANPNLYNLEKTETRQSTNPHLKDSGNATAEGVTITKKGNDTLQVNVVMKPSPDANKDLVVIGYGAKKSARMNNQQKAELLEPTEGWGNFNDYVAQNLQEPERIRDKATSGEVELQFEVNENGEPTNIKVVRSLCAACDAEAVRLLKEGPKWKSEKKKKGKVTIRF